jgi:hypothetical protein
MLTIGCRHAAKWQLNWVVDPVVGSARAGVDLSMLCEVAEVLTITMQFNCTFVYRFGENMKARIGK